MRRYFARFATTLTMAHKLNIAQKIDNHAHINLLKPDTRLENALKNSNSHGLPQITVSPLQGQFLSIQCQLIGAKSVLEVGTLGGYSSIWFAKAGAKVTTIEINPKHRDVALENTKGLDVDIILGAALDVLPKLAAEGKKFDLVFLDASWDEQWQYFEWAVKLTRPNGCIYVDNVIREMFEHENVTERETLVTKVGRDDRVTATLVPMNSSHKARADEMFDGFLLAVVKDGR